MPTAYPFPLCLNSPNPTHHTSSAPPPPSLSVKTPADMTCFSVSHVTSSPLSPPHTASSISSQERELLITHSQASHPLPGFTARQRHIHEQTNRKEGWLSGGLVTLPLLIPRQGLMDFLLSVCATPCPLHSPVIIHQHMHVHKYVCVHISAGIMKCVSYDQGGCACCLLLSDVLICSVLSLSPQIFSFFSVSAVPFIFFLSFYFLLCLPQYFVTVNIAFQLRKKKDA